MEINEKLQELIETISNELSNIGLHLVDTPNFMSTTAGDGEEDMLTAIESGSVLMQCILAFGDRAFNPPEDNSWRKILPTEMEMNELSTEEKINRLKDL